MKFRFFKGNEQAEPLRSISNNWFKAREERNSKLQSIFDSIPFYNSWYGDETSILGIICDANNPALKQIENKKGYKVKQVKDKYLIRPDRRYKEGKELDKKINAIQIILKDYPDFSRYALKQLGLYRMAAEANVLHFSVCGVVDNTFIARIPVKDRDDFGDAFPEIPDYLTEIKESEFLAIQGR